jgi:hypothetical protein
MKDAKPAKTPMGTDGHVDLNKGGKSVDQKCHIRFWKVNRMQTMYVSGSEIHVHSDYINDSS